MIYDTPEMPYKQISYPNNHFSDHVLIKLN